jgi:hypothetical protein
VQSKRSSPVSRYGKNYGILLRAGWNTFFKTSKYLSDHWKYRGRRVSTNETKRDGLRDKDIPHVRITTTKQNNNLSENHRKYRDSILDILVPSSSRREQRKKAARLVSPALSRPQDLSNIGTIMFRDPLATTYVIMKKILLSFSYTDIKNLPTRRVSSFVKMKGERKRSRKGVMLRRRLCELRRSKFLAVYVVVSGRWRRLCKLFWGGAGSSRCRCSDNV